MSGDFTYLRVSSWLINPPLLSTSHLEYHWDLLIFKLEIPQWVGSDLNKKYILKLYAWKYFPHLNAFHLVLDKLFFFLISVMEKRFRYQNTLPIKNDLNLLFFSSNREAQFYLNRTIDLLQQKIASVSI